MKYEQLTSLTNEKWELYDKDRLQDSFREDLFLAFYEILFLAFYQVVWHLKIQEHLKFYLELFYLLAQKCMNAWTNHVSILMQLFWKHLCSMIWTAQMSKMLQSKSCSLCKIACISFGHQSTGPRQEQIHPWLIDKHNKSKFIEAVCRLIPRTVFSQAMFFQDGSHKCSNF